VDARRGARAASTSRAPWTLCAALAPGAGFAALLTWAACRDPRFAWVLAPAGAPWPVLVIAIAGGLGAAGAIGDYRYHRAHDRPLVGEPEHRSHLMALVTGGLPLFAVMIAATLSQHRGWFVVPAMALSLYVAGWVAYDAFVFHRRRKTAPREQTFHAMTLLGNTTAFLAWAHWLWAGS